jgi:O-methyltransferase
VNLRLKKLKQAVKRVLPRPILIFYHLLRDGDWPKVATFLVKPGLRTPLAERLSLLRRLYLISEALPCPHTQTEMLRIIERILALPPHRKGCLVEAGCYKGGSTAKLSLAAEMAGRKLAVFDSFQGLPEHHEPQGRNIFGQVGRFPPGEYRATLEEVKENIIRYGAPRACEFYPGWFEETMPRFAEPIALLFLDVDLAGSTRVALKNLYPRLVRGGVLFSHDAHLPPVVSVFRDAKFWEQDVGCPLPLISGLGRKKLIRIEKTT